MSARNRSAQRTLVKSRAPVFAALGDETRLTLVGKLSDGDPQSIAQLTAASHLTRQAVTKHLAVLEGVGIVNSIRSGRENLFVLTPEPIRGAKDYLDLVAAQWDSAFSRLKKFVED